ncbi:hypothetical protein CXB51_014434 [Gossypium anomalum]|uniref:Uncharacterized protein n=1 Tax=Gossypium anomalum TaxID=47600 RepID=A0A8J5Z057_9ROSI|nr:hypothetical protein CXB51_014434 [Gossypium anomalum]
MKSICSLKIPRLSSISTKQRRSMANSRKRPGDVEAERKGFLCETNPGAVPACSRLF